jgi:hypothetical protein
MIQLSTIADTIFNEGRISPNHFQYFLRSTENVKPKDILKLISLPTLFSKISQRWFPINHDICVHFMKRLILVPTLLSE